MRQEGDCRTRRRVASVLGLLGLWLTGCTTGEIIGSSVGATVLGANTPSQEIQQTYYLGAFDPQEQLPPTVYRIRLHGQASFISFMRFASGWVPAPLIDSLSSSVGFEEEKTGGVRIDAGASEQLAKLTTGRRLMVFGPEGFREAPRDHRLVVVMGSSPEDFFEAIDESLGIIAEARASQADDALDEKLFQALIELRSERQKLQDLERDVDAALPPAHAGSS